MKNILSFKVILLLNSNYKKVHIKLFSREVVVLEKREEIYMAKRELFWAVICVVLILLAYFIPYTVLTNVFKWYGSFLYWVMLGVVIIVVNVIMTKNWRS